MVKVLNFLCFFPWKNPIVEKDVKFEFRNEHWIDGLKPSTPYEIVLSAFGYSTSRTASFTFTTLTEHGGKIQKLTICANTWKKIRWSARVYLVLFVVGWVYLHTCSRTTFHKEYSKEKKKSVIHFSLLTQRQPNYTSTWKNRHYNKLLYGWTQPNNFVFKLESLQRTQ